MHINFDNVDKRGYTKRDGTDKLFFFKNPSDNTEKDTCMLFMVNMSDSVIIATIAERNEEHDTTVPVYTLCFSIIDSTTETDISNFFKASELFFKLYKSDFKESAYDDEYNKLVKDSNLSITIINVNSFIDKLESDESKKEPKKRVVKVVSDPNDLFDDKDGFPIVIIAITGFKEISIYKDGTVLFDMPRGYGEDESVTSDMNAIFKAISNFIRRMGVLDLFITDEDKRSSFAQHLKSLCSEIVDNISNAEEDLEVNV